MINRRFAVHFIPWWDVDHHAYGCPLTVVISTPTWWLGVRPFSGYAQGGDLRGMTDFHGYDHSARWVLERPRVDFETSWWMKQYCRGCGHVLSDCSGYSFCPEGTRANRLSPWGLRYWRVRYRDETVLHPTCLTCLHDVETCQAAFSGYHESRPARWLVFPRHLLTEHVIKRRRCRVRFKDTEEVEVDHEAA